MNPLELPLHDLHVASGARLGEFAGWLMPIHYPLGILGEHRHARGAAALFDVSHMGQIVLRANSGDLRDAAMALERLVPVDVLGVRPGRQRYGLFTTEEGGVIDDLMIANLGDCLYLVVNAAGATQDFTHLRRHLGDVCRVERLTDRVLLALQGPQAAAALVDQVPEAGGMRFMDAMRFSVDGATGFLTRSGYTGEDGFEISLPADGAERFVRRLVANPTVAWVGLGARDSLRLEAGLCLYGHELTQTTSPVEAALEWAIGASRRSGGARAGGYPGAAEIASQLLHGVSRRRVGLRPEGRPVRDGAALYASEGDAAAVGHVTSGTFAPSLQCPIAMGYVPLDRARPGSRLYADVRGQRIPMQVCTLPFVTPRYHR